VGTTTQRCVTSWKNKGLNYKTYSGLRVQHCFFSPDFTPIWTFHIYFRKSLAYKISRKSIQRQVNLYMRTDRQTDITKLAGTLFASMRTHLKLECAFVKDCYERRHMQPVAVPLPACFVMHVSPLYASQASIYALYSRSRPTRSQILQYCFERSPLLYEYAVSQ
jgi:hypothetical protein